MAARDPRGRAAAKPARRGLATAALVLLLAAPSTEPQLDRLRWLGETRNIAVLAATTGDEAPLLLVLGDPGRSARYALDAWRQVAASEGLIVAAVSSAGTDVWRLEHDGPGLLRALVEHVGRQHEIDRRRIYLFGTGSGGGFALYMGVRQPWYFAAVASFGGDLPPGTFGPLGSLERPIPLYLLRARKDPRVATEELSRTAERLEQAGAAVHVEELGVPADFERRGRRSAALVWSSLGGHVLDDEARYLSSRHP